MMDISKKLEYLGYRRWNNYWKEAGGNFDIEYLSIKILNVSSSNIIYKYMLENLNNF